MIKPLLITLASAALAIVPGVSVATPRAGDAAPAASAAPAPAEAATKYCVYETPTGSHIRKKTCLTRDQWIKSYDFDPTEK
jgi:hypothetical protein